VDADKVMVTHRTQLITIRHSQDIILTSPANNGWPEAYSRHKIQITPGSGQHVFVNIWAEPRGHAWSYQAAYDLVLRLRVRTGIAFDPHWCRHSAATRWLRDGVPIEVVSTLLGHSSVSVTSSVYGHLTVEDARAALEKAGWLTGREVTW
jgi:site-specific recombinase XerD